VAVAVVGRAAVGVAQHLVGLGGLLEFLLGLGVAAVDIGVELRANRRKAFFIWSSPASRVTPSTS